MAASLDRDKGHNPRTFHVNPGKLVFLSAFRPAKQKRQTKGLTRWNKKRRSSLLHW
jgi:hypothetical protein